MTEESAKAAPVDHFLTRFTSAQTIIAAAGATLLPIFLALKLDEPLSKALAVLTAALILGAFYLLWRRTHTRRLAQLARQQRIQEWAERPLGSAFRGLYSYTRGDKLPGDKRRQLAKSIATRIAHPDFTYGVVTGETGAGKSSLLDSGVAQALEEDGRFTVVYLRGLRGLSADDTIDSMCDQIRFQLAACTKQPVLIFDQFEEALIKWIPSAQRRELGNFLKQPLPGTQTRVVCAVRSDYVIALHDLRPGIEDPTSSKTMFPLKNLDLIEAAAVIEECATRDGLEMLTGFGSTLAAELAHDGRVRPPELQLVCLALEISNVAESYRAKGGAKGILSAYIVETIEATSNPSLARLVLRSLCNFSTFPAAKTEPQSAQQLGDAIRSPEHRRYDVEEVASVLEQLTRAGVIVSSAPHDQTLYSLVHDYAVDLITAATAAQSTEAERATHLLRLHLSEFAADRRSFIPLGRLNLILAKADPELVASSAASVLIRRSQNRLRLASAAMVAAVVVGLSGVALSYSKQQELARLKELGDIRRASVWQTKADEWRLKYNDSVKAVSWASGTQMRHDKIVQNIEQAERDGKISASLRDYLIRNDPDVKPGTEIPQEILDQ
ncbi:ATP-binding protein [Sphingosinicella sp. BN140058]|uniref:nSTAND1 domain-containing NTPase n=1 Tax=Sphingosinicella sp. BN140058 TaxID=1892855 RepID=UPI001011EA79|nr:ATP-binding protein [Sphingosinicella sp. BN140058]QAY80413.1 hypothetical protein ETR14_27625 [Sphingosinicella sp. BN140058]